MFWMSDASGESGADVNDIQQTIRLLNQLVLKGEEQRKVKSNGSSNVIKFEHSFIVKPDKIDVQGHVNNVRYVQWIQDVAVAHWFHAASTEQLETLTWVVLRHEIDYLLPAFANEEITARTWVGQASAARCERFTEIRRGDKILAQAKSLWCALDAKTLRPRRIDDELKERFGAA
jgi:acyl-CoA thioester hydrolase